MYRSCLCKNKTSAYTTDQISAISKSTGINSEVPLHCWNSSLLDETQTHRFKPSNTLLTILPAQWCFFSTEVMYKCIPIDDIPQVLMQNKHHWLSHWFISNTHHLNVVQKYFIKALISTSTSQISQAIIPYFTFTAAAFQITVYKLYGI